METTIRKLNEELSSLNEDYQKKCNSTVDVREYNRLTLKLRDIEAKYNIELAQRQRAEALVEKFKDEIESAQDELGEAQQQRDKEIEAARKAYKDRLEADSQVKDLRRKLDMMINDLDKAVSLSLKK